MCSVYNTRDWKCYGEIKIRDHLHVNIGNYTREGELDAILTLLNVIIYSSNPTVHVLCPAAFTLVN